MHATELFQNVVNKSLGNMDPRRVASLRSAVGALLVGKTLSLTSLGRNIDSPAQSKHTIKRMDRLLGNKHIHRALPSIYQKITRMILEHMHEQIVVLVDWTPVGPLLEHHALVASIPMRGRAVTIYSETHPEKKLGNPVVHQKFLETLRTILPASAKPVIVTDAGFHTSWFDSVQKLGWDFVGRLRGNVQVRSSETSAWEPIKQVFDKATEQAQCLGIMSVTASSPRDHRLILVKKETSKARRMRGKKKFRNTKSKKKALSCKPNGSSRYKKSAAEPWLLITSLDKPTAKQIVKIYSRRMQIEETFRDYKSHRYGWGFADARCQSPARYNVLLIIAALASIAMLLLGIMGENHGLTREYQANSIRRRRVLSLFFLGNAIFSRNKEFSISIQDVHKAWMRLGGYLESAGRLI